MSDAFFRAGVGALVVDDAGRILVLRRKTAPDRAWQLPQGGIGFAETPLDALYRELAEETGLLRSHVEVVASTNDWWLYELPVQYRNAKVGWGQAQRWYLCRLLVPRAMVRPDQIELAEADWVAPDQLAARAVAFRVPIYRRLIAEFASYLQPG
jgi:putative (di)nucleoside polyphosphate hydrolase